MPANRLAPLLMGAAVLAAIGPHVYEHHYLGFRQFAGRGLRHVAVWRGHWLALVGWQSGAFKCAPRDRWLRWHRSVQFRRLHLIANNTRFLVLPASAGVPNLASRTLGRSLRRLSADWAALHGHPLELAETFVDPSRFRGACYDASNWVRVGRTKGFARHNGGYTDPHDCPKEMFVRPLRADARTRLADARTRLADPADRPEWACRATPVRYTHEELRSLRGLFAEVPDSRRGQGRKHRLATVLSVCALARLAGQYGPAATERFARNLDQEELRALGAWRSGAGRWVAPSDSTVCRVLADTDPDALQDVLRRWAAPRLAEDAYFETVTLVTHAGRPLASRCCRDEGGETAALRALLEDVDLRGCVVTLDPLHSTRDTERAIVETHGANYMLSIKTNCPDTFRGRRVQRDEARDRRPLHRTHRTQHIDETELEQHRVVHEVPHVLPRRQPHPRLHGIEPLLLQQEGGQHDEHQQHGRRQKVERQTVVLVAVALAVLRHPGHPDEQHDDPGELRSPEVESGDEVALRRRHHLREHAVRSAPAYGCRGWAGRLAGPGAREAYASACHGSTEVRGPRGGVLPGAFPGARIPWQCPRGGRKMPLSQDITPFDENLADTVVAASDDDWLETDPGKAWMRLLWTQGETGRHAGIYRWKKGYAAPSHKHIGAVYVYVISGSLQVRDNVLEAGDFLFEPNGMIHHKTEALEDVDYLMLADGPVIGFDENGLTGYFGWEELRRLQAGAALPPAAQHAAE